MIKKNFKRSAVILCGGKGTRLGLIGKKIPKSLVQIHNYPIIWYILKILKKNSFNHFILPAGYKIQMIKKYLKKNRDFKDFNIEIVDTGLNTQIAKRIFLVKEKVLSNNFLLLNGDAIFDFNLKKIFDNHERKKKDITYIGCENQLPYGTVGILNNKIISFNRDINFNAVKTRNNKNFTAHVYSGMSIMNKKILKINFKDYENFEKKLYPKLIKKMNCNFVNLDGFWHSVDNIKDIEVVKKNNNRKKYNGIKKILKKF